MIVIDPVEAPKHIPVVRRLTTNLSLAVCPDCSWTKGPDTVVALTNAAADHRKKAATEFDGQLAMFGS